MRNAETRLLAFAFISLLVPAAVHPADSYLTYTTIGIETLFSLAEELYAELPHAEAVMSDNRGRAFLIYRENLDLLETDRAFFCLLFDRGIYLPAGLELAVPVFENGYPSPAELESMIDAELARRLAEARDENEFMGIRKSNAEGSGPLYRVLFREGESGAPTLERAWFRKAVYALPDGTLVPRTIDGERQLFVWQIIEHSGSGKTVFLFPEGIFVDDFEFRKYLVMDELARANFSKDVVLLDLYDSAAGRFADPGGIVDIMPEPAVPDYRKVLASPLISVNPGSAPCRVRPVTLLKSSLPRAQVYVPVNDRAYMDGLKELENRKTLLETTFTEDLSRQMEDLNGRYMTGFRRDTDLFIREIEAAIFDAADANKITGREIIERINRLQLDFAAIFLSDDFGATLGDDAVCGEIESIFSGIDNLCGSSTVSVFSRFREQTRRGMQELSDLQVELAYLMEDRMRSQAAALQREIDGFTGRFLGSYFTELGPGNIVLCEMNEKDIETQIALALNNEDYNLVVYHSPFMDSGLKKPGPEERDEGSAVTFEIGDWIVTDDVITSMIPGFTGLAGVQPEIMDRIRRYFVLFRDSALLYGGTGPEENQVDVTESVLEGIGSFFHIARYREAGTAAGFFFISGKNAAERRRYIDELSGRGEMMARYSLTLRCSSLLSMRISVMSGEK